MIPRQFFERPAVLVAPELLGCLLVHDTADGTVTVELTEVEAYMGEADPASHAYRGQTKRNAVMFGPPGHAYVYFTYGMHFCVNLVCLPPGTASAVLLRAGRVIQGEDLALERRRVSSGGAIPPRPPLLPGGRRPPETSLTPRGDRAARGPARLCQALGIDRSLDGADVCLASSALRIGFPSGGVTVRSDIRSGPRVGVSSGAEVAWRFWVAGEPSVSEYRAYVPRKRKPVTPMEA